MAGFAGGAARTTAHGPRSPRRDGRPYYAAYWASVCLGTARVVCLVLGVILVPRQVDGKIPTWTRTRTRTRTPTPGSTKRTDRGDVDPPRQLRHATILDDAFDRANPAARPRPVLAVLAFAAGDGRVLAHLRLHRGLDAVQRVQHEPDDGVAGRPRGG